MAAYNAAKVNPENLFFVVETFAVQDGRSLKAAPRDTDGYYQGVPLAVFNNVTRNRTVYDVDSMIDQITNPNSAFNIRLTEGNLIGEWGHPRVNPKTEEGMQRVLDLENSREACCYRKIYSKKMDDSDMVFILGDVKPSGPYGKYFEERMDDPTRNCAFSLRSITKDRVDRVAKIIYRKVIKLVTFDAGVPSGGYKEASKRYMISNEELVSANIDDVFTYESAMMIQNNIGLESFTDVELENIFGSHKVTINNSVVGVIDTKSNIFYNIEKNKKQGLITTFLRTKK